MSRSDACIVCLLVLNLILALYSCCSGNVSFGHATLTTESASPTQVDNTDTNVSITDSLPNEDVPVSEQYEHVPAVESLVNSIVPECIEVPTADELSDFFLKHDKAVVFFYTKSCAPCDKLRPFVESLVDKNIWVATVDVGGKNEFINEYKIKYVPDTRVYTGGSLVRTVVGDRKDEIEEMVSEICDTNYPANP